MVRDSVPGQRLVPADRTGRSLALPVPARLSLQGTACAGRHRRPLPTPCRLGRGCGRHARRPNGAPCGQGLRTGEGTFACWLTHEGALFLPQAAPAGLAADGRSPASQRVRPVRACPRRRATGPGGRATAVMGVGSQPSAVWARRPSCTRARSCLFARALRPVLPLSSRSRSRVLSHARPLLLWLSSPCLRSCVRVLPASSGGRRKRRVRRNGRALNDAACAAGTRSRSRRSWRRWSRNRNRPARRRCLPGRVRRQRQLRRPRRRRPRPR